MIWRILTFIVSQLVAAALGWWLTLEGDALAGGLFAALIVGYIWLLLDMLRGARMLEWLRGGSQGDIVLGSGLWAEASDRMRRLLRSRERLLKESEERLKDFLSALQASPNGVILLDDQGRIEWFNQTSSVHFGLDPKRDLQQHLGNLVRDPGFAAYFAGKDFQGDLVMPGRQSTGANPVRLSVHRHPYGEGRSLLLSRDITALEQADAMRRDFVANVSHEIRTPLTVLAGFVETLQTLPLTEAEQDRYLDLMAQQAQRMQTLVNDLLTLSRLEGSPPPPAHEWVSVQALLNQCEQDGSEVSKLLWNQTRPVSFAHGQTAEVAGTQAELYSAMFNLVSNAIRYTPLDQSIDVRWEMASDGSAKFCVRDTGAGIAPEHLPRLTERFYRVDRSRSRETGGTGLGLAIVKHVAHRHGAKLLIESIPGKGSTFCIVFPSERVRVSRTA